MVARFLSLKLAAVLLVVGVALIAIAGWHRARTIEPGPGEIVVHVPRKFWPGSKPAPEMDQLMRRLRPGEEVRIKLVFADSHNHLAFPVDIDIRRGSLFIVTHSGYFRIDSQRKLFSCPTGEDELDLEARQPTLAIYSGGISAPTSLDEPDFRFQVQNVAWREEKGQYIAYIAVKKSPDFEGDVTGWRSTRGW
jgi:hypothetical protein